MSWLSALLLPRLSPETSLLRVSPVVPQTAGLELLLLFFPCVNSSIRAVKFAVSSINACICSLSFGTKDEFRFILPEHILTFDKPFSMTSHQFSI